jgi:hypothetical protein
MAEPVAPKAAPPPAPPPPVPPAPVGPVQRLYDAKTGEAIDLDPQAAVRALADGTAGFAPEQEVVLRGPEGPRKVSGVEARRQLLFGRGVGLGTEDEWQAKAAEEREADEYGGIKGAAEAAGAGALRGITFGASDWVARQAGVGETFAKLQKYNPGASIGGELVGAALPAVVSAGASAEASGALALARGAEAANATREAGVVAKGLGAIGRATEAVGAAGEAAGRALPALVGLDEAAATSRVLTGLGRGAAEGALQGVGQAISEASLKDDPITIDKLLAGGGMGALLGGWLGGGIAGLGVVTSGGVKALGRTADWAMREESAIARLLGKEVRPMLDDFATQKALSSLGPTQRMVEDLRAFGPEAEKRVASRILNELPEAAGKSSLAQMRRREIAGVVEKEREIVGRQIGQEYKALDEMLATTGVGKPELGAIVGKVMQDVIEPMAMRPGYEGAATSLARTFRTFTRSASRQGGGFEAMHRLSADLGATARKLGRANPVVGEAYQAAFRSVRQELERAGDEAARAAGAASFSAKIKPLNAKYADYVWMSNAVKRGAAADVKNRTFGLSEALASIRGQSLGSSVGGALGSVAGPAGQAVGAFVGGAVGSVGNALVQHVIRTYGDQAAAVLAKRAVQSDALRAVTQTVDEMVSQRVKRALSVSTRTAGVALARGTVLAGMSAERRREERRPVEQRYAEAVRKTASFAASGGQTGKAATDRVRTALPDVAWQLDQKGQKIAANIQKRVPAQSMTARVLPMGKVTRVAPSREKQAAFLRYYEGATEPLRAIDRIADGSLAKEHVEALEENYKPLLDEVRAQIVMRATEGGGKGLPYARRAQLGLLLGAPTDVMVLPEVMAATRGVYDELAAKAGGGGGGGGPPGPGGGPTQGGGAGKVSYDVQGAGDNQTTRAERVEGREA